MSKITKEYKVYNSPTISVISVACDMSYMCCSLATGNQEALRHSSVDVMDVDHRLLHQTSVWECVCRSD